MRHRTQGAYSQIERSFVSATTISSPTSIWSSQIRMAGFWWIHDSRFDGLTVWWAPRPISMYLRYRLIQCTTVPNPFWPAAVVHWKFSSC